MGFWHCSPEPEVDCSKSPNSCLTLVLYRMRVFSEAQIGQGVPRAFDKAVRTWLPGLQRARVEIARRGRVLPAAKSGL